MYSLAVFYDFCRANNVLLVPVQFSAPAVTMRSGDDYAIAFDFRKIPTSRFLNGVTAHESGHVATGALHKVCSPYEMWERSEYRANKWEYEHVLPAEAFREAFSHGIVEPWELAEYFDMPEDHIKNALAYWSEQKGYDFNSYK